MEREQCGGGLSLLSGAPTLVSQQQCHTPLTVCNLTGAGHENAFLQAVPASPGTTHLLG